MPSPSYQGDGDDQEVCETALGLVRIHGGKGEPQAVIDGNMHDLGPDVLDAVLAVAGQTVRRPLDAPGA
jgi:hypothetical protein